MLWSHSITLKVKVIEWLHSHVCTRAMTLSSKNVKNVNVTDTILWQGHHDRVLQLD